MLVTFAQNREDLYLYALLGDGPGRYVDVGANHPVENSVTKFFYDRGWRGINIEPNAGLADLLGADRPEDVTLAVGVSDRPGTMELRIYTDAPGLSTFSADLKDHHAARDLRFVDRVTPVATLAAVLTEHSVGPIDFMKVDAEGHEDAVLRGNDWVTFRPRVLVIEGGAETRWRPFVESQSYSQEFFDGLNFYFVADECRPDITILRFAERVLADAVYPSAAIERIADLEAEVDALRRRPMPADTATARGADGLRRIASRARARMGAFARVDGR